jgi:NTE family protein
VSAAAETPDDTAERIELLARVRLFAGFRREELEQLAPQFTEVEHAKGKVLFSDGDEGGDFFVVARGELEVLGGAAGTEVINRLGPGDHLGEMALLLGTRRTATVRVARAARLLVIGAADFQELTERHPAVLAAIARELSRRLDARTRGKTAARKTLAIGVTGPRELKGKSLIGNSLAALLAEQTGERVLVIARTGPDGSAELDAEPLGRVLDNGDTWLGELAADPITGATRLAVAGTDLNGSDPITPASLTALVERAQARFALVILDLGPTETVPPQLLGEACDLVIELVAQADDAAGDGYGPSTRVLRAVNRHNSVSRPFAVNRGEPFLLRDDPALWRLDPREQASYMRQHPRSPAATGLHRLARKVRGASVGVALAGGAAFGLAHIGVLQALEQGGVPIDLVTGTSMGSIVGAIYATGMPAAEIIARTEEVSSIRKALSVLDPAVMLPGLLAGNRVIAIVEELGAVGDFDDLALPYQAMATDIETGERVPIATGSLAAACRASSAIPGIFAPVRRDGRILVDGFVADQVPTSLVREMGADVCIAVTVVPTLRKGVRTAFTRVSNGINALNPLSYAAGARGMPTLIDVVMHTFQMVQYQLGAFQAVTADAHVEVDTTGFTWVDFHKATPLIECGVRACELSLPQIQRALADRPLLAP